MERHSSYVGRINRNALFGSCYWLRRCSCNLPMALAKRLECFTWFEGTIHVGVELA